MGIKVLDKSTAEQIAAGEVIENPASVVKELVENALDAGASKVDIAIENGGKSLIVVTDNGCGMEEKELPLAFKRFATSKISFLGDLEHLASLGFRGEALPSIAAVARVTLTTRTAQDLAGSRITLSGGEIISQEETGAPPGTRVEVSALFYNTPGRRKFLRAANVESSRISTLVSELALTNPQVAFTLKSAQRVLFRSSGDGVLLHVIGSLYGTDAAEAMLELNRTDTTTGHRIDGFISAPHLTRSSRRWITPVVNGRLIKSPIIVHALERGYGELLSRQRHPLAIVNLTVSPGTIDVNVHPAKIEIRFQEPELIKGLIYKAVKLTLQGEQNYPQWPGLGSHPDLAVHENISQQDIWKTGRFLGPTGRLDSGSLKPAPTSQADNAAMGQKPLPTELRAAEADGQGPRLIGQFMHSYLVVQQGNQLLLIDQHAAHESIIYHQLKTRHQTPSSADVSQLTIPLTLELPPAWSERLPLLLPLLEQAGFKLAEAGENKYRIGAVPFVYRDNISTESIYDLLEILLTAESEPEEDAREKVLKTMACHRSIKAKQPLSREEMEQLLDQWEKTPAARYCPHGRPTVISIDRAEIDKSFHRSGNSGGS